MKRLVAIILCLILVISGCAPAIESKPASQSVQEGPLRLADLGVVDIHTADQQGYLDDDFLFVSAKGGRGTEPAKGCGIEMEKRSAGRNRVHDIAF